MLIRTESGRIVIKQSVGGGQYIGEVSISFDPNRRVLSYWEVQESKVLPTVCEVEEQIGNCRNMGLKRS